MAKLRLRLTEKDEIEGSPLKYRLVLAMMALTDDSGNVLGNPITDGGFTITGLSSTQVSGLATGTIFNCPVQT